MWNFVETIGAFIIALGLLIFFYNIRSSYKAYRDGGRIPEPADPWDARSLEWMTPNPTPHHNFDEIPIVTHQDELWHRKYAEDDAGRPVAIASSAEVVQSGDQHPHLPGQSYWPITLALGLPVVGYGLIFNLGLAFVGGAIILTAIYGWIMEPAFEHHDPGHGDDGHGDDHGPDGGGDDADAAVAEAPEAPSEEETPVG